jgi:hypothetical protein
MTGTNPATLIIYWTDTRVLLSYEERHSVLEDCRVISITSEVLLNHTRSGRMIAVCGSQDPMAPHV